jgi:hypothetical protein
LEDLIADQGCCDWIIFEAVTARGMASKGFTPIEHLLGESVYGLFCPIKSASDIQRNHSISLIRGSDCLPIQPLSEPLIDFDSPDSSDFLGTIYTH